MAPGSPLPEKLPNIYILTSASTLLLVYPIAVKLAIVSIHELLA
ncbi:hypothetical protein [Laspinema olomoucense]|nr:MULTISPECIES: hypothetical protein [unclassified Laspinema]